MTFQSQHGTAGTWNNGSYIGYDFGPTGAGNGIAVYDPNCKAWKLISISKVMSVDLRNIRWNNVPGRSIPANVATIAFLGLNTNGDLFFNHYLTGQGALRADPETGISTSAEGLRSTLIAQMYFKSPGTGVQGQGNSEYLIDRHQLWTTDLVSRPCNVSIGPGGWVKCGEPVEFVTWSDKLPTVRGAFTLFNDVLGSSIQVALVPNGNFALAGYGAAGNPVPNTPINISAAWAGSNLPDGFYSIQLYVKANVGTTMIGHAVNSDLTASIWF